MNCVRKYWKRKLNCKSSYMLLRFFYSLCEVFMFLIEVKIWIRYSEKGYDFEANWELSKLLKSVEESES